MVPKSSFSLIKEEERDVRITSPFEKPKHVYVPPDDIETDVKKVFSGFVTTNSRTNNNPSKGEENVSQMHNVALLLSFSPTVTSLFLFGVIPNAMIGIV